MNEKIQLQKLEENVNWLLYQSVNLQTTFSAVIGVGEVTRKTDALSRYGDYFGYTQNIMISDTQLQLSKLYVENKDSHSLPKVIRKANNLFTERYFLKTGYNPHKTYQELKNILEELEMQLVKLEIPIDNLKKLRNKDLAHLDKGISNVYLRDELVGINPIYLSDAQKMIYFSFDAISKIKGIMFNITPSFKPRDYVSELEMIAKAIEERENDE